MVVVLCIEDAGLKNKVFSKMEFAPLENIPERPDEERQLLAAARVDAEYYEFQTPTNHLLMGRERRVVVLKEWNVYIINRKLIRGLVSVDPNYGEIPEYLGVVQVNGEIRVELPVNLVNTMIAWWEHRRGGKTEENFDISVIYFDQIFSAVGMSSEKYMVVRKWVPVIAYIQLSDVDARLMKIDHSWSQYLFKTVKFVRRNKLIMGGLFLSSIIGFKIRNKLNGK